MYKFGAEQSLLFVVTRLVILGADLVVGAGAGLARKALLQLENGTPIRSLFRAVAIVFSYAWAAWTECALVRTGAEWRAPLPSHALAACRNGRPATA